MESAAQCEVVTSFLDGLGEAFGLEITTSATLEDGVLAASIDGSEVGLFIGPVVLSVFYDLLVAWVAAGRKADENVGPAPAP